MSVFRAAGDQYRSICLHEHEAEAAGHAARKAGMFLLVFFVGFPRWLHRWSTGRLGLRMQKRREEKTHQKLLYLVSLHGLEDPKIRLTSSIAHFSQVARKIFWLKSAANTYPLHATHVLSTSEEILKKFDP